MKKSTSFVSNQKSNVVGELKLSPPDLSGNTISKNENIWWVKDNAGVIVIDNQRKIYWLYNGLQEEIWILLMAENSFDNIIETISRTLSLTKAYATNIVTSQIGKWLDQGIFRVNQK